MAWLLAVPNYGDKDRPRLSRREEFKRFRAEFDEPPQPDDCIYLLEWFIESGMTLQGPSGPAPLTWSEVQAFDTGACKRMTAWEREVVVDMSRAFVSALSRHADPKSPPPYTSEQDPLGKLPKRRSILFD